MVWCTALNCKNSNRKSKTIRFYSFPTDPERRKKWEMVCRRDNWQSTKFSKLCEKHFEEIHFERNRKDGWRKLKPNAVPTLCDVVVVDPRRNSCCQQQQVEDTTDSVLSLTPAPEYLKPQTASSTVLIHRQKETEQGSLLSSDNEDHPSKNKRRKSRTSRRWSSWKTDRIKTEDLLHESFDNSEDNEQDMEEMRRSSGYETLSSLNGSNGRGRTGRERTGRGSPGMASSRLESLRSSTDFDRVVQTPPSKSLERQMENEEENLIKEWDTTVRCRQENSLSIRPLSISTDDTNRISSGLKAKSRFSGFTPTVDLASSPAVRFEFPEIDIVKRHDTSLDDGGGGAESSGVEDDSRRFTYAECPTTGRRTMRLEMNVEGYEPRDISVKCSNGRVTVHGITYDGKKSTNEFCRKVKLPEGVSAENLRCTFCEHVLVLEALVQNCCSTPDDIATSRHHALNRPVVMCDENGRYLSLVVELGRIFRPSDVVVKVKGQQTICVFADAVENTSFSRMKAKIEREFDLPEKIDQKSLRAGCTEDRLLKIVARCRDAKRGEVTASESKAVKIDFGDSVVS